MKQKLMKLKKIFFEIYNKKNNNGNNINNKIDNDNNKNSNEIIINDYYFNKLKKDIKYNQIVFKMKENMDNFYLILMIYQ